MYKWIEDLQNKTTEQSEARLVGERLHKLK